MSKRLVHCHQCGSKMLERHGCKTCQGLRAQLAEAKVKERDRKRQTVARWRAEEERDRLEAEVAGWRRALILCVEAHGYPVADACIESVRFWLCEAGAAAP